jgi:hypothetical protein
MIPPPATIDQAPPLPRTVEEPVFAARRPARPRAVRIGGRIGAGIVGLWLVAFLLGTFGFGYLPGLPIPHITGTGGSHPKPAAHQRSAAVHVPRAAAPRSTVPHGPGAPGRTRRAGGPAAPSHGDGRLSSPTGGRGGTRETVGRPAPTSSPTTAVTAPPRPVAQPTTTTSTRTTTSGQGSVRSQRPSTRTATSPGSRSQSSTAPGRAQSNSTPAPGSKLRSPKSSTQ